MSEYPEVPDTPTPEQARLDSEASVVEISALLGEALEAEQVARDAYLSERHEYEMGRRVGYPVHEERDWREAISSRKSREEDLSSPNGELRRADENH